MLRKLNQRRKWVLSSVFTAILAIPQLGQAGLYSAPMNPADNTGPESAWNNPAGMSGLKTSALSIGVGGLFPNAKWETTVNEAGGGNGGNSGPSDVLPLFFFVTPIGDKFHFGISYLTPLGGVNGLGWDFGDDFSGRYASQSMTFASNAIAVSGSWQATDKWSFGAGLSEQWLNVNYSMALNTPNHPGDGQASLVDISDWAARWYLGAHYQASSATSVGLVWRSKWTPELEGPVVISNLPIDVPTTNLKYKLPLPQQLELGIQHALSETWILGLVFDWENWTQFNNMVLDFDYDGENPPQPVEVNPHWRNTYSIGANVTKVFAKGATFLNFGAAYGRSPVTDENRLIQLPADDSWTLTIGVGHNFSKALTASLGTGVVFGGSAPVEQVTQGFQFAGKYGTNRILILGGSLAWRF